MFWKKWTVQNTNLKSGIWQQCVLYIGGGQNKFGKHLECYYTGLVGKIYEVIKIVYKWSYDLFLTFFPLESRALKQTKNFLGRLLLLKNISNWGVAG